MLQGKQPSNHSSLRNLCSLFPSQPRQRRRDIEAVGWRELGSWRRRITRGIPCINHNVTRPARPWMTWPNHIAIRAPYAHTKSSPSSPSRGGGPGAPLRPVGRLSARAFVLTSRAASPKRRSASRAVCLTQAGGARGRRAWAARAGGAGGRRKRAARAGGARGWREVMVCRLRADGAALLGGRGWPPSVRCGFAMGRRSTPKGVPGIVGAGPKDLPASVEGSGEVRFHC